MADNCCAGKQKHRTKEEQSALINRLSRIEGQVRGIKGMIEREAYCTDIITQVAAIRAALASFQRQLLEAHINTCVTEDIQRGELESRDELLELLSKLL